jgi:hypothetical protein
MEAVSPHMNDNPTSEKNAVTFEPYVDICPICGGQQQVNISSPNARFLRDRKNEGNLDEAIAISRICWDNFPTLRLSSDSKTVIEEFMASTKKWLEEQAKQILKPVSDLNNTLAGTVTVLSTLSTSLPEGLKPHIDLAMQELDRQRQLAEDGLKISLDGLRKDIETIEEHFRKITYKPTEKGRIGQASITSAWSELFPNDKVTPKGGPGESDLLVEPYLGDGKQGHLGTVISVERKAGKQSYSSIHLHEAVKHAKNEGAKYVVLLYDSYGNLAPQSVRIDRMNGIFYAVCEFESNTWKIARQLIGLLQENEQTSEHQVDLTTIRKTVEDMAEIEGAKSAIERENEKACKANDSIRQRHLPALSQALREYATKLQQMIEGQ